SSLSAMAMPFTGSIFPTLPRGRSCGCGCEIPRACWLPDFVGEVESSACGGTHATLRVRVTNCGATRRVVYVASKAPHVTIAHHQLSLDPLERGVAVASLAVPATARRGEAFESLVWVHGCRDHAVRLTVVVDDAVRHSCPDVDVDDCPDTVHHWYDHFYCEHPCPGHVRERGD